eukprot:6172705-Alexandrium_andersonii.AAC.1
MPNGFWSSATSVAPMTCKESCSLSRVASLRSLLGMLSRSALPTCRDDVSLQQALRHAVDHKGA